MKDCDYNDSGPLLRKDTPHSDVQMPSPFHSEKRTILVEVQYDTYYTTIGAAREAATEFTKAFKGVMVVRMEDKAKEDDVRH